MPRESTGSRTAAHARAAYVLELARGCSYISSTLTADTRKRAIAEVLGEFHNLYGDKELAVFRKLLAEDLQRRDQRDAASAVVDFKSTG